VVNTLRRPPVRVAAGTVAAASTRVALLVPRIRLRNRQIKDAHSRIDGLTARRPKCTNFTSLWSRRF
jgi:hypothetical protein